MNKRVLLTGINGYVGQHVAAELLRQGYEVIGTVRSRAKSESVKSALSKVVSIDKLSLVEVDLLSDSGWDAAMVGCDFVAHVASPFSVAEPKDERELIDPAVEGTKRVLTAAKFAGVKRVVLTSSIVAMTAGKPSGLYGPDAWSDVNANIGAYAKSKTLAERAAWEIVAEGSMELVVINPGFILGPPLGAPGTGVSETMISNLIAGKMPMIPDVAMGMVDVRDVARLHVAALSAEGASGKRFIAASEQPVAMAEVANILKSGGYTKVSTRKAPNFAIKAMGLIDREARAMAPQLGKKISYDNHETFGILGWKPTQLKTTFLEMAGALSS
jgi:dihydroflavonol-4-reductase